ncbi:hypothetical protein D3C71_521310 [compost metagenome]
MRFQRLAGHQEGFAKTVEACADAVGRGGGSRRCFLYRSGKLPEAGIGNDPAVGYFDDTFSAGSNRRIMGDDDDGAAFGMQLVKDAQDLLAACLVERAGWLVRQDHVGIVHQRAGNRHALLLAAGEMARPMLGAIRHAEASEQGGCPFTPLAAVAAGIDRRDLDIGERRDFVQQMIALEDEAEMLAPQCRAVVVVEGRGFAAGNLVGAFGRPVEQSENVHQGRLAGAGGADDRDHLAAIDRQVDVFQHGDRAIAGGIIAAQAGERNQGFGHRLPPIRTSAAGRHGGWMPMVWRSLR